MICTEGPSTRVFSLVGSAYVTVLGLGLGPLITSSTLSVFNGLCRTTGHGLGLLASLQLLFSLITFFGALCQPHGEELSLEVESADQEGQDADHENLGVVRRGSGVLMCAVLCCFRALVVSNLEAATAMILERDFSWSQEAVGMGIGATFSVCVLFKLQFDATRSLLQAGQWIRVYSFVSLLGCALLFRTVASLVTSGSRMALSLLCADALLFPSFMQTGGLTAGIMASFALPAGGFFSLDNLLMLKAASIEIGRTVGPPMARAVVDVGGLGHGQDLYAQIQCAITLTVIIINEYVLFHTPAVSKLEEKPPALDLVESAPNKTEHENLH